MIAPEKTGASLLRHRRRLRQTPPCKKSGQHPSPTATPGIVMKHLPTQSPEARNCWGKSSSPTLGAGLAIRRWLRQSPRESSSGDRNVFEAATVGGQNLNGSLFLAAFDINDQNRRTLANGRWLSQDHKFWSDLRQRIALAIGHQPELGNLRQASGGGDTHGHYSFGD